MGMQEISKEVRLQKWAQQVKTCRESGLSVAEWCRANGMKPSTYYNRQQKVARAVSHELTVQERSSPSFIEYHPTSFSPEPMLIIHLPNGTLEIHKGADTSIIEQTLRTLSELGLCCALL
ncbi:MAG: hypothetical protein PHY23_01535 [Oscillospiraceae bacterium]|jgi:hypothetical protein|nr:hypothetical protein [Oscillospiraceae bacterium]